MIGIKSILQMKLHSKWKEKKHGWKKLEKHYIIKKVFKKVNYWELFAKEKMLPITLHIKNTEFYAKIFTENLNKIRSIGSYNLIMNLSIKAS